MAYGDYNFAEGFQKWAEMDAPDTLPKIMGQEAFRKMMTKINQMVTLREDTIWRYQPDLSYYPGVGDDQQQIAPSSEGTSSSDFWLARGARRDRGRNARCP